MSLLTEEMILAKTRCTAIEKVRNLNMFGSDLEDVSILKRMQKLEVLSLSVNKIASLQPFSNCSKLQELYLRKNEICDIQQVAALRGLKYLHTLWLGDNPCASIKTYRTFVIYMLPRICKLDGIEISTEERNAAEADFADRPAVPAPPVAQPESLQEPAVHANIGNNDHNKHLLIDTPPAKTQSKPPTRRTSNRDASTRPVVQGVCDSPRVVVGAPRPALFVQDSPRRSPALTGESNKHVIDALLCLVKDLNLDGLMMLKTDVDVRIRTALAGGTPAAPSHPAYISIDGRRVEEDASPCKKNGGEI